MGQRSKPKFSLERRVFQLPRPLIHTGDPLALLLLRGKEEAWMGRQQNLRLRQEIRIP